MDGPSDADGLSEANADGFGDRLVLREMVPVALLHADGRTDTERDGEAVPVVDVCGVFEINAELDTDFDGNVERDCDGDTDGLASMLGDAVSVDNSFVAVAARVSAALTDAESDSEFGAETLLVDDTVRDWAAGVAVSAVEADLENLEDSDAVPSDDAERETRPERDSDGDDDMETEIEALGEAECVREVAEEALGLIEAARDCTIARDTDALVERLGESEEVPECELLKRDVFEANGERDSEPLPDTLADCVVDVERRGDSEGAREADAVAEIDALALMLREAALLAEAVSVPRRNDALTEIVRVSTADDDGVAGTVLDAPEDFDRDGDEEDERDAAEDWECEELELADLERRAEALVVGDSDDESEAETVTSAVDDPRVEGDAGAVNV
jgi:hypothetical protein